MKIGDKEHHTVASERACRVYEANKAIAPVFPQISRSILRYEYLKISMYRCNHSSTYRINRWKYKTVQAIILLLRLGGFLDSVEYKFN